MRNKKCWNFDFFRRTIPLGIAIACAAFVCTAQETATSDVKEVTDPKAYSAGKMSAAEIDKWFADNIKPSEFDIWNGKKERTYLNGAWKLMLLSVPYKEVKLSSSYKGITAENSDFGEKHGFFKKDFDDSKWFNQPVPLHWSYKFEPNTGAQSGQPILGWYRKHFTVPESWGNKRVILTFRAVTFLADVYLNGVKLATHEESRLCQVYWTHADRTEESFSVDISSAVKFGQENVLAVKVFAPCYEGGIWQEVYVDAEPVVFAEKALITPDPAGKQIKVKAFIVNTTGQETSITPSVTLASWKSPRYTIADWKEETVKLTAFPLKPGTNEIEFNVPVDNPRYWSPEHPNLYHFTMKDERGTIMGQERFGFRTFTVGERSFLLNDKPFYVRAAWEMSSYSPGVNQLLRSYGILNRGGVIEKYFKSYMGAGYNYQCPHQGTYPPHVFLDVADELGLILATEEKPVVDVGGYTVASVKDGVVVLQEKFKQALRDRCLDQYNHPSVVAISCGNEVYDSYALTMPEWRETGFGPLLRAIYDEYKKYDKTRPITASSGRGPTQSVLSPVTIQKNKGDYDDGHLYGVEYNYKMAENDDFAVSFKKNKSAYTKDNGGVERVMLNGESVGGVWIGNPPYWTARSKDIIPNLNQAGEFDRKWLASNLRTADQAEKYYLDPVWAMIPFSVSPYLDKFLRYGAQTLKMNIEMERRKRESLAGYEHNECVLKNHTAGEPYPHTYAAAKMAQQGMLPCVDGLFNRNMITGRETETKLYLINDTEDILKNVKVSASLQHVNGSETRVGAYDFAAVAVGGMETQSIKLKPPASLTSGHYRLILEVVASGKSPCKNEYDLYVLNQDDIKAEGKMSVAVYAPGDTGKILAAVLSQLKIAHNDIKSFDELTPDIKILMIPPNSCKADTDSKALLSWVDKGGKLLAFEQDNLLKGFLPGRMAPVGLAGGQHALGWWTELVLFTHPIFKDLNQEDFYFWSGDKVNPETMKMVKNAFIPLNEGVLAMLITAGGSLGISACEMKQGEGRVLFSQIEALGRFGVDSVATKYIVNTLNYTLNGFDDPRSPVLEKKEEKADSYTVNPEKTFFVDLRPCANMAFADEVAGDKKGGWSDQGPENDARSMPLGRQTFAGVPFSIIDPGQNNGKACIVLQGDISSKTEFLPKAATRIIVNRKAKKLYFLVSGTFIPPYYMREPNESMASIDIGMDIRGEGTIGKNRLELVAGKNFGDWWQPKTVPEALIGWRGMSGKKGAGNEVGAYVVEWRNPEPGAGIGWIDFRSAGRGSPILIAVTGEEE